MLHAVVMAGGSGTRFWPMSRTRLPKQMLALVTDRPLIVETVARLEGMIPPERTHVITNAIYADQVREFLPELPAINVVPEPIGRDTAACIGVAAAVIARRDPAAVLAILAADHVVDSSAAFRQTLSHAEELIRQHPDLLVTLGVRPTRPATGYGYLEQGETIATIDGVECHAVGAFREKPDEATAREFVASGRFFWNAGIFVFKATAILERIERFLPELSAALPEVADAYLRDGTIALDAYNNLQKISIDYGVMERDDRVAMIECGFQWDDVGSFAALERVVSGDDAGNRVMGQTILLDASNNVVLSSRDHAVALLGVEGLVVVHTDDVTLVCRKEDAERVKQMVDRARNAGRDDLL